MLPNKVHSFILSPSHSSYTQYTCYWHHTHLPTGSNITHASRLIVRCQIDVTVILMACLWLPQYNKRLWEVVVVGCGWGERRGWRKTTDRHTHIYRQSRYCCFNTSHILYLPSFCLFVWFDSHCLWWFIQTCATCTIKHYRDGTFSLAITNDLEWHIFASG